MSTSPKPGAVLFAKEIDRVAMFYQELVPMERTHGDDEVIVLESLHQQLVIHGIPKRIAKSITITAPPRLRENTAVKLVFSVASIAAARMKAPLLGGKVDPEKRQFEARGFRACDGHDPEGNVVQFRESAG